VSDPQPSPSQSTGRGIILAVAAYGLWGFLPLFFLLLAPANALEIVAWRILFSLVFCAILLTATRSWPKLIAVMRDRRIALTLLVAGILILINWLVYVYATLQHEIVQAALGYFINPIVTVLLGIFVLRERLRTMQWVAIGISAVAILVIAIGYGAFPWISLALAFSFGLYGLIKKRVGGKVDAVSGLTMETLWLAPIAVAQLGFVAMTSGLTIGTISPLQTISMLLAGVVTAVPLLLFAGAARILPLTVIGLTQYVTPLLQFLIGVVFEHEAMPLPRLIGFVLVWVALGVLTVDMFRSARARRSVGEPVSA
jgi:chloramphenicol-sensitive protein RarD